MISSEQATTLWRFFDGNRVQDRMPGMFRRLVYKHGSFDERPLLRLASVGGWVARKLGSPLGR
jgi:hypothetical protein